MTNQVEDEGHKFCVICGKFGSLNEDISYGQNGYTCWGCLEVERWENGGRVAEFLKLFGKALLNGKAAEAATFLARESIAHQDEKIEKLKQSRRPKK
jgi:hypothetical protein